MIDTIKDNAKKGFLLSEYGPKCQETIRDEACKSSKSVYPRICGELSKYMNMFLKSFFST